MPLYMLDTDTVSYLIRGGLPMLDERMAQTPTEQVCISAVTRAELLYGVHLKPGAFRLEQLVEKFLTRVRSMAWDALAADRFASVAAGLTKAGTPIGVMDTMIATHALAASAVLVTNNTRHFSRVPKLKLENWAQDPNP